MSTSPSSDVMTLAGLAQANGPWLAVRLRRLAEHAGLPLPEDIVEGAVLGSSRVLAEVLGAEGRPAVNPDLTIDPAARLGREQAQAHRQAGMDMPGSVLTLRLMRRSYDDLVRESWVEKDSRARAHEDVERFFERMLIGHVLDWAGSASAPPPPAPPADSGEAQRLAGLLAQREDDLARLKGTARQAASELLASRERTAALSAELDQVKAWAASQKQAHEALKAELAAREQAEGQDVAALRSQLAAAKTKARERIDALTAGGRELEARRAELEARLAEATAALEARGDIQDARDLAMRELENARAEAQAARDALDAVRAEAAEAVTRAEAEVLKARAEAEAAADALRAAHEGHATLASEAEAMRARLSETGSRLAEARKSEEQSLQARLDKAQERARSLESELRAALQKVQGLSDRLAEQESLHAFKDERMGEQSRAIAETQELLVRLGATKDEIISRSQNAEADRDRLAAELAAAKGELATSVAARDGLDKRAKALEEERVKLSRQLASARGELAGRVQAITVERDGLAARLLASGKTLEQYGRQAQAATGLLSAHLAQTADAVAAVDASGAVTAWNQPFQRLFGLAEADRDAGLAALLPRLALRLQNPGPWLARVRELLANPAQAEDGLTLAGADGATLIFRSQPAAGPDSSDSSGSSGNPGAGGRLLLFSDVSLEHDMEALVREIESITRHELGQSLTAFIHLPQELLDDPAVTPAQAEKLTVIRDSGFRVVNTVNMAVDIFRMERGLYQPPLGRTLDLAVVARRAAKDASPLAEAKGASLELLLGDGPLPPDTVLSGPGDPIPAHALALSLLRDAMEAAPPQAIIRATLGADEATRQLRLDITRPGTLDHDELTRYFHKPVGADAQNGPARARHVARLIAASLGGEVFVSTGPGGTTVSLRLPRGQAGG